MTLESAREDGAVIQMKYKFPSLYNYQSIYTINSNQYPFLSELTPFFNGIDPQEYLKIIEEVNATIIPRKMSFYSIERKSKTQN
jgi:hypothetical protein